MAHHQYLREAPPAKRARALVASEGGNRLGDLPAAVSEKVFALLSLRDVCRSRSVSCHFLTACEESFAAREIVVAHGLPAEGVALVLQRCPSLTHLDLSFSSASAVNDKVVEKFWTLPQLAELKLNDCPGLGGAGVNTIALRSRRLRCLELRGCGLPTSGPFYQGALPLLERLDIKDCHGLQDAYSMLAVCMGRPRMQLECGTTGHALHSRISSEALNKSFNVCVWPDSTKTISERAYLRKVFLCMKLLRHAHGDCYPLSLPWRKMCHKMQDRLKHYMECRGRPNRRTCKCCIESSALLVLHAQQCLVPDGECKVMLCNDMKKRLISTLQLQ